MSRPMTAGDEALAELMQRPLAQTPTEDLTQLFARAEKPRSDWMLGLEIEILPFFRRDRRPVDHAVLARIFEALLAASQREHGQRAESGTLGRAGSGTPVLGVFEPEFEASGALIGLKSQGQVISLEPGGQLEFATRPHRTMRKLRLEVEGFYARLRAAAEPHGVGFWACGRHPFATLADVPRMPKARYELMRSYLRDRGARSLEMMHLTGSVQCAVDFSDERSLAQKVRTAAKVSPYLTALTASSPFTAGKPNGRRSDRYAIWLETDRSRSGLWPEMVDAQGMTYGRYVERALDTPAMFFLRDGKYRQAEPRPYRQVAREGFEGTVVTVADFVDHMTSLFPEIRVKGYVELRGSDCLPPPLATAIAAFWRGLLGDDETSREVLERLAPMGIDELNALQPAVATIGLDAQSAAGPVRELIKWIVELTSARMHCDAAECATVLDPLVELAQRGRSVADEMLERAAKGSLEDALTLVEV